MPFIKRTSSRQVHPSVDSRKIFIGRANELYFFVEDILKPEDPSYNIVSISGIGGVGKSTLLARFIDEAHLPHFKDYCLTAAVDDRQLTPENMMERFAHQLSGADFPLIEFEKTLTRYKETLHKRQST
jgi:hypothetical protein